MSTYKTYVDRFAKSKSIKRDTSSEPKLTTDKEAYTQFLEIQLERISQAILQLDSFNDKIQGICTQVNTNEEKLNNSNKLLKLLQSFADGQEGDNIKMQEKIGEVSRKQHELSTSIESQYVRVEDFDTVLQKLATLEKKLENTTTEKVLNERITTSAENVSNFYNEKDKERSSGHLEQRIMDQVNYKIETYLSNLRNFEEKIEDYNDKFSKDVAMDIRTLENRMSEFIDRLGTRGSANGEGGISDKALNSIKEDLYQKIEIFMDELKNTPSMVDIEELKGLIEREIQERKENFEQLEKYYYVNDQRTLTLGEDLQHKLEDFETKLQDFEIILHRGSPGRAAENGEYLPSFPEEIFSQELHKLKNAVRDLNSKVGSSTTMDKTRSSGQLDMKTRSELDDFEKRISDNMIDGFDRFSGIIKKHMEKSKRLEREFSNLNERVLELEDSLPSRSRSRSNNNNRKPASTKNYASSNLFHDDTVKGLSASKENPFLQGRMGATSKGSPRQNFETEARASFGYSSLKSRGLQQLEKETNLSDLEDNRNRSRSHKRATGARSRSRSAASNKSLNASYMSGYSGKENQSPMLRKGNGRSSKKQERKRSESLSISVTPKRRNSVRSTDSYKSDKSGRSNSRVMREASNKKTSNIKQMQNKIELERKMREEKIKKLIQKSKPPSETPKFTHNKPQGSQVQSSVQKSKKGSHLTSSNSKSKNVLKSSMNSESLDRNLRYDYNFTTKGGDKLSSSTHKDSKKYQKLDELKNSLRKQEL